MKLNNNDTKLFNEMAKYKVRCKCSHTNILARVDRTICKYCGNWVYRTPEIEFKYKMKEQLKREENNDN